MKDCTHIFFDLDDTLWDFRSNAREAFRRLMQEFGDRIPAVIHPEEFLAVYIPVAEALWTVYGKGELDQAALRKLRMEQSFAAFGVPAAPWMQEFSDAYVAVCPGLGHLFPGTTEVLEQLQRRYTLGILTNGFPEVQAIKLTTSGLRPFFSHIVTTDLAMSRKPDQIIFDFAIQVAQSDPSRTIMVGDHYEIDIVTPDLLGWKTILVSNSNPSPEKSHLHVKSLQEILSVL